MSRNRKGFVKRIHSIGTELFGFGKGVAFWTAIVSGVISLFAIFWFFHSAVPRTLVITSGPAGSMFQSNAEKYRKILARNGIQLKILPSEGSLENLKRLSDSKFRVDIGFVQGGLTEGIPIDRLVSLGSVSYEPLLVFYRSAERLELISALSGKRIAVGPPGSGTRALSLTLLAENGVIQDSRTSFIEMEAEKGAADFLDQKLDVLFLTGDAASQATTRRLMREPGVRLFDFSQADGYIRRINYLSKLTLPMGSIDFGKNIPDHDVRLISPTVELIARDTLHPAVSDLLIEAAREVHGNSGIFKKRGEFPAPLEHEFQLSDDALRYYRSGKGFLYRYLPFWLATLSNRLIVAIVPLFVILVPALKLVPMAYQWRTKMSIYRWYRALLRLEQDLLRNPDSGETEVFIRRLDHIEREVNRMKMPASNADQFYELRGHIRFVRDQLLKGVH